MSRPTTSLQLYSLHAQLDADLAGTAKRISDIGFTTVEAFDFVRRADELADVFGSHGLSAPTGHSMLIATEMTFNGTTTPVASHADTFRAAQTLGVQYVIDPAAPDWTSREAVTATATALNTASRVAADYGVRVGYHNHAWEISNLIDGTPAIEVFADLLDDSVALEVDLYWAYIAGADVPALLTRLGERVKALHIKDGPLVPNPFLSDAPIDLPGLGQRPAGQGDVPLREALAAATAAEYAVIEFDHYDGDIFDAIAASHSYLENLA
ncbi:MAG: sugar phosphate isomerase/epimerase family protein [Mycetocola sp.]